MCVSVLGSQTGNLGSRSGLNEGCVTVGLDWMLTVGVCVCVIDKFGTGWSAICVCVVCEVHSIA